MADNFGLTQIDLVTRLLDGLPAGYSKNTVKTPNSKFTTPKNSKWLRITVLPGTKVNVQAGGKHKRTYGICVIDCFYPLGSGDVAQLADTELLETLFENQEFGNTKTEEAYTQTVGEDGSWYNQQVNINFNFEGE